MMHHGVRQRSADELAQGYDHTHRRLEIVGIALFFACEILVVRNLVVAGDTMPWAIVGAAALGWLAADLVSGLVHWAGDSWGDPDFPILGRNFIRPFRHHHVDPLAITRHDFIATNGNNCMTTLLALVPAVFVPVSVETPWRAFFLWFVVWLTLAVFATNQLHKWAHLERPPAPIRWLQRLHLVLPPDHHDVHHARPYDDNYCITVGWLNGPLRWIRFFRTLERVITAVTGQIPRREDIHLTAPPVTPPHGAHPADR